MIKLMMLMVMRLIDLILDRELKKVFDLNDDDDDDDDDDNNNVYIVSQPFINHQSAYWLVILIYLTHYCYCISTKKSNQIDIPEQ